MPKKFLEAMLENLPYNLLRPNCPVEKCICLSLCFYSMKRHQDHSNTYRSKTFNWDGLIVLEV